MHASQYLPTKKDPSSSFMAHIKHIYHLPHCILTCFWIYLLLLLLHLIDSFSHSYLWYLTSCSTAAWQLFSWFAYSSGTFLTHFGTTSISILVIKNCSSFFVEFNFQPGYFLPVLRRRYTILAMGVSGWVMEASSAMDLWQRYCVFGRTGSIRGKVGRRINYRGCAW
jgi:hypothetical protein